MSMKLPTGQYYWLTPEEISALDPMAVEYSDMTSYLLEVDLHYPPKVQVVSRQKKLNSNRENIEGYTSIRIGKITYFTL